MQSQDNSNCFDQNVFSRGFPGEKQPSSLCNSIHVKYSDLRGTVSECGPGGVRAVLCKPCPARAHRGDASVTHSVQQNEERRGLAIPGTPPVAQLRE